MEAMTKCKKPDMAGLQELVTPVGTEIQAADKLTQVSFPMNRSVLIYQCVESTIAVSLNRPLQACVLFWRQRSPLLLAKRTFPACCMLVSYYIPLELPDFTPQHMYLVSLRQ